MGKPFHAMRVAIQFEYGAVAPKDVEDFDDTKDALVRIYSGLGFNDNLMEDIEKLRETGRDYVRLLESRQRGELSESELGESYSRMLDRIRSCYPEAFHFVEQNARRMMDS